MPAMDGCVMDSEGCIWVADVRSACLRIAPGGAVVDAIFLPDQLCSFACTLGGPDGKTLMICAADSNFADRVSRKSSFLFTTRVDVPAIS
jgi:sugar lactone lactonase YvrE